jgi:hypothetical protein
MTDARVEAFLVDILALEGANPDAIRDGVHVALADCPGFPGVFHWGIL